MEIDQKEPKTEKAKTGVEPEYERLLIYQAVLEFREAESEAQDPAYFEQVRFDRVREARKKLFSLIKGHKQD